jgi:hypothetical protein
VTVHEHSFFKLGQKFAAEKLNDEDWDRGTQDQALQSFELFSKLLCEAAVYTIDGIVQAHFNQFKLALTNIPKSYGKSPADPGLFNARY